MTRVNVPDLRLWGFNDIASSVINNTEDFVIVYKGVDFDSTQRAYPAGKRESRLVGTGMNDEISSLEIV